MSIGYACLAVALPGSEIKSCTLKNATEERLYDLIAHNLNALETMVDYNLRNGIRLYRISSDLIPFGSSVALELPWADRFSERLASIGEKIRHGDMRVSLHPGQYTVLNSPIEDVAARAVLDLDYHARILDAFGLDSTHKIVLHLGGVYGDKATAKQRFVERFAKLSDAVKQRLILENDGSLFHIEDVLETAALAGIPVVYDNLHNETNPADPGRTDADWIAEAASTWGALDGRQKIHYSQQNPAKSTGAHSETIHLPAFLDFYHQLPDQTIDIMLEVKDKNISALKCHNATVERGMKALESEWARYKYGVLEKSPQIYQEIRDLLKDKQNYPALAMYALVEYAYSLPLVRGHAANAAQHVWGYFKDQATEAEKRRFLASYTQYTEGDTELPALKRQLLRLAGKYEEEYLLHSYYFYM
ncbi:MAG: UV DNA damage repair endonuclease UvsE [Clostridiaceae bacterium]|nr:UV DNA damage repair endonuclease UvsE [Clostridiaceae bacterium]